MTRMSNRDAPPPGQGQDTARTTVSVADAAARLGITHDAVRKKLQRGTLPGEKADGAWLVFLPAQDIRQDDRQDATDPSQDTDRPRVLPPDGRGELLDQLRSEVAFLRGQLAQRAQEADQMRRDQAAERERFDVIHREALHRIEALTAGPDEPEADDIATEPHNASPAAPGATEPPAMTPNTSHEPSVVTAWVRKLFGRS